MQGKCDICGKDRNLVIEIQQKQLNRLAPCVVRRHCPTCTPTWALLALQHGNGSRYYYVKAI